MSVFEQWSKAIDDRDAGALIDSLREYFEFVCHQSGTSLNKAEMSDMLRIMVANESAVSREIRCLYENDEVLVMHSIMEFPDGTTEAILQFSPLKDGKILKSETGATPLLNSH